MLSRPFILLCLTIASLFHSTWSFRWFWQNGEEDDIFCHDFYNREIRKSMIDIQFSELLPFVVQRDTKIPKYKYESGLAMVFGKNKLVFVQRANTKEYYYDVNRHSYLFKDFIYKGYGGNCLTNLFLPYVIILCDERTFVMKKAEDEMQMTYFDEAYPGLIMVNSQKPELMSSDAVFVLVMLQRTANDLIIYEREVNFESTSGKLNLGFTTDQLKNIADQKQPYWYFFWNYQDNEVLLSKTPFSDSQDSHESQLIATFLRPYKDGNVKIFNIVGHNSEKSKIFDIFDFYMPKTNIFVKVSMKVSSFPGNKYWCWFKDECRDYYQLNSGQDIVWTKTKDTSPDPENPSDPDHPFDPEHNFPDNHTIYTQMPLANKSRLFVGISIIVISIVIICCCCAYLITRRRSRKHRREAPKPVGGARVIIINKPNSCKPTSKNKRAGVTRQRRSLPGLGTSSSDGRTSNTAASSTKKSTSAKNSKKNLSSTKYR